MSAEAGSGQFVIVWRYEVADAHRESFEQAYGPGGDWAQLFGTAGGFIGTELLVDGGEHYMTLDRWRSEADFEAFQVRAGDAYRALDARCETLTSREERIGAFSVVGEPRDRAD
ncbi:antibiotic biosynthesis monooxygenase family protein [Allosphingosinicella sp.]|uniref:antibiotic biosynthesis monooxygenase family protein n=1 Tax=Allosphingosinicella sp. TaxID=2823234 RepID=UPI002FC190F5